MESVRYAKVDVRDLQIGMYVVELDRPWIETPFLVEGFIVKSVEELEVLGGLCRYVYVDTGRSRPFHKPNSGLSPTKRALTKERLEKVLNVPITPYEDTATFDTELESANRVYRDYGTMVSRFYDDIRVTKDVNIEELKEPVNRIVESVIRNPDACMLLARLRRKGDYTYNHAIGSSVWAAAMGRQLGLPRDVMSSMSIGALLLDVGKLKIPDRILNKISPLTLEELEEIKKHIQWGMDMVKKTRGLDKVGHRSRELGW